MICFWLRPRCAFALKHCKLQYKMDLTPPKCKRNGRSRHFVLVFTIENKHCNKGGVAHGGLYTMMLDMALGGALVSILPKAEWCATTNLNVSFISRI